MTPAMYYYNPETFAATAEDLAMRYRRALENGATEIRDSILSQVEDLARGTEAPLERIERALVGWVSFLIVPIFALANAGVSISGDVASDALSSSVSQGVAVGLVLGKPAGIFLFTFLAVKLGICDLPRDASWPQILGVGLLGGIGFTVALLISDLSFRDHPFFADEAKLGVLAASATSAVLGMAFLFVTSRPPKQQPPGADQA
jgi:NhaA family Na+:H+ antiporter